MRYSAAFALLFATACSVGQITPVAVPTDASVPDTGPSDASSLDATSVDGTVGDAGHVADPFVRIDLLDGSEASGELVATYDHSLWQDFTSDELTYALFTPASFASFPNDRSFRFVSSSSVASITRGPLPPGTTGYRDFLRQRRILFERSPLDGPAYVITANETYHLAENGFGDFAWDLVRTASTGERFVDLGLQNEDYLVWDSAVFLPVAGTVVEVVGHAPDNVPGVIPPGAVNNLVGVRVQGSFLLYLLHFRQNTVSSSIAVGQFLPKDTYLGQVGNSGVSLEPHLHMTVLWYVPPGTGTSTRSWSVPSELANIHTATSAVGPSSAQAFSAPPSGVWISNEPF